MPGQRPPARILDAAANDGVTSDHARILAVVERLRTAPDGPSSASICKELSAILTVHMAEEEAVDGVFVWLCALQPQVQDAVAGLISDHGLIRTEAAALLDVLPTDPGFSSMVRAFADHIQEHERREAAVLWTATQGR